MKSLQTKIIILILCSTLLSVFVVLAVGFVTTEKTLDEDSGKIMNLLCTEKADQINETLRDIEQSVNIIYHFAVTQIGEVEHLAEDENAVSECIQKIREVAYNVAENTEGAIAIYFRLIPEISSPVTGIFLTRQDPTGAFEDTEITDLSKFERDDIAHVGWYYLPIEAGRPIWMDPYMNENIDVEMISYVIPIFDGDQVIGVVGMDIDVELLRKKIRETVVYDTGYAFLLDSTGNIVYHRDYPDEISRMEHEGELQELDIILQEEQQTEELYHYQWNGMKKQMISQKLVNGMSIVIAVPLNEVEAPKWELLIHSLILVSFVLLLSVVVMLYWVRSIIKPLKHLTEAAKKIAQGDLKVSIECNSKDEVGVLAQSFKQTAKSLDEYIEYINRLAYTDALTGIKNKTAYEESVAFLDEEIKNENTDFAVVVMDINNLKLMNDVYGHEKGDMMIIDTTSIMKKVFGTKPVFRIGGDEFVAIIMKEYIPQPQELRSSLFRETERFNKSSSKRYESELQIACGIAIYDQKQDFCYADVFRRADSLMYENKKQQKGQQAK